MLVGLSSKRIWRLRSSQFSNKFVFRSSWIVPIILAFHKCNSLPPQRIQRFLFAKVKVTAYPWLGQIKVSYLTFCRVIYRGVEGVLSNTESLAGDADSATIKRLHRDLKAHSGLSEHVAIYQIHENVNYDGNSFGFKRVVFKMCVVLLPNL